MLNCVMLFFLGVKVSNFQVIETVSVVTMEGGSFR